MKIGLITNAAFSIPILQLLVNNKIQASVFSDACFSDQSDMPAIKHFCGLANIPVSASAPDDLYQWLKEVKPDVVFIIGYRHLIRVHDIDPALQPDVYNIHFGALPSYKGPNPVFWQIKNGAPNITTCIHRINERFDDGPLIWSKAIKREVHMSYGIAHTMLGYTSSEGVVYILQHLLQKKQLPVLTSEGATPQYYKRPAMEDIMIRWDVMNASQIIDLAQACNPWNRGASTICNGAELKIIDAFPGVMNGETSYPPGTVISCTDTLQIACIDNTVLHATMLNMDGTFVPARHTAVYGIAPGLRFG